MRKLVESDPAHPRFIQTVWGQGYVYVPDDDGRADGSASDTLAGAAGLDRAATPCVTLYPRSLFGRLALLLVAAVTIATVSMIVLFRQDRAALITRQVTEARVTQSKALQAAIEIRRVGATRRADEDRP